MQTNAEAVPAVGETAVHDAQRALLAGALDLHVLHHLPYYDALVVQAAIASGCKRVLSEDLHHGGVYSGVRVENPFRAVAG